MTSTSRGFRVLVWIGLLIGVLSASSAVATRLPSPNRECSTCHIMWLMDFKRDDVTPLIPYEPQPVLKTGKQDVSSTPRMCFSCHDGFVLDSRYMWKEGHRDHPMGQVPSKKMTIPKDGEKTLFPLNDDGKVYCGTCHTAHGVDWESRDSAVFMRVRNVDGKLCEACHLEKTTGPKTGTHTIHSKPPEFPEALKKAGAKLSSEGNVTCQSCHRPHGAADDKILVVQNDNSQLCGTCHADRYPHSPEEAGQMGTHPINVIRANLKVPQELFDNGAKLGRNGAVICQTCHTPHGAATDKKLLVRENNGSALCNDCHEKQRVVANTKHNMTLLDANLSNSKDQKVGEQGVCSACHMAHGGRGPKMWARNISSGSDPMAEGCLSCHRAGGVAEKYQVGHFSHRVGMPFSMLPEAVSLPGFSRAGVKTVNAKTGMVTCASCHDAHQWDPGNPALSSKPGDKSNAGNRFLRKPNVAGSVLCLTCHKDKSVIKGSKHDMAVMAPEEQNIKGQLPQAAGPCSACHVPHNGTGPAMWARQPGKGADPISSTCLSCHNPQGAAHKKLVGEHSHPLGGTILNVGIRATVNKWISRFQDIAGLKPIQVMPLFDAQGQRATEGGVVSCASCHDPHKWAPHGQSAASADPHKLEGDAQSSFLRIANDASSSLCVNCHRENAVVSLSKHNLNIGAPQAANTDGLSVPAAGLCSACHAAHKGQGMKMWSRSGLDAKEGANGLCTSCHRQGGLADSKFVGHDGHPVHVPMAKASANMKLPLYTADGARAAQGLVECATCHNPHQWDPGNGASTIGANKDVNGDADTSFLRLPAVAQQGALCTECHN